MRKDVNFFSIYHSSTDSLEDKFKLVSLSLLVGSLVLVLAVFTYLKISDLSALRGIEKCSTYLQSSDVLQAKKTLEADKAKISALNRYKQAAQKVSSGYAQFPKVNSKLLETIAGMEPSDVEAKTITYDGKALTLICTCRDSQSPAVFVHCLDKSGKFQFVNYSALESAAEVTSNGSYYSFSVVITLKGGA